MLPERWQTVKDIFHEALEQPADRRSALLDSACGADAELRAEVERLLAQHAEADEFLERPALAGVASDFTTDRFGHAAGLGPGSRVGSYTIEAAIGEGGMSTVYRAVQDSTKRTVAIKVLRAGIASREVLQRFRQESRLLGRLQHPGIAQVLEAGIRRAQPGGGPFFAMELVEGLPVTRYAEARGLPTADRLRLLAEIADAVHHAHLKGVIHRDLKPDNILVDAHGQPKVLDFGVARATDSDVYVTTLRTDVGKLIGTIPYMSPEQVAGDPADVDARSDVYALGVVGYELLTGRLPYDLAGKPIPEALQTIGHDEPIPLRSIHRAFRGDVQTILAKALEKDRTRRYQSAAGLAADIRRHLRDEPIAARPASSLYQLRKFTRRNKALVAGVLLAFVGLLAAVVGTTWQSLRAREQLRTAQALNLFLHDLLEAPFVSPQGRDVTVLELLEQAAGELETRFADKPQVKGPIYLAIGNTYQQVGQVDKAERYVRSGVSCLTQAYGAKHADTLMAMAWLALLLERQGRLEQAEQLGNETVALQTEVLGPEHPYTLSSRVNLANVLRQRDRLDEAEARLRAALEALHRTRPADSLTSLHAQVILAQILTRTGAIGEAEMLATRAYDGFLRTRGGDDWRTLLARSTIARVWQADGRLAEAQALAGKVLEQRRAALGEAHPDTCASLYQLAALLAERGDYVAALEQTEAGLACAEQALPPGNWRLARLRALRGLCQWRLGRLSQAKSDLSAACDQLASELGPDHGETRAARDALRKITTPAEAVAEQAEPATRRPPERPGQ